MRAGSRAASLCAAMTIETPGITACASHGPADRPTSAAHARSISGYPTYT